MFFKIVVPENYAKFARTTSLLESLFNKFLNNSIKKRLQHRCFSVNILQFLGTTFFIEHLRWLILLFFLIKASLHKTFALVYPELETVF